MTKEFVKSRIAEQRIYNDPDGDYLFQTNYRASNYGDFDSTVEMFLNEADINL